MNSSPCQKRSRRGSLRAAFLSLALVGAPALAEPPRAILPSEIPAAEKLLDAGLPPTLDARVLLAYRTGRRDVQPEGGVHPLLGTSVRPTG